MAKVHQRHLVLTEGIDARGLADAHLTNDMTSLFFFEVTSPETTRTAPDPDHHARLIFSKKRYRDAAFHSLLTPILTLSTSPHTDLYY
jgi:hypothetical protein